MRLAHWLVLVQWAIKAFLLLGMRLESASNTLCFNPAFAFVPCFASFAGEIQPRFGKILGCFVRSRNNLEPNIAPAI